MVNTCFYFLGGVLFVVLALLVSIVFSLRSGRRLFPRGSFLRVPRASLLVALRLSVGAPMASRLLRPPVFFLRVARALGRRPCVRVPRLAAAAASFLAFLPLGCCAGGGRPLGALPWRRLCPLAVRRGGGGNMNRYQLDQLIYSRYREREARENARPAGRSFPICPKQTLPCVPFKLWAAITLQEYDVMSLKPYRRAQMWRDYALDLHYMGFDPEHSSRFGLYETFP
jgi:hypothetical protein